MKNEPIDERLHRQAGVGLLRELRVAPGGGLVTPVDGDACQHLVRDRRRDGDGELRVRFRLIDAAGAEQRARGAGQRRGILRVARDYRLVGGERLVRQALPVVRLGKLEPHVGHARIRFQQLAKQLRGFRVLSGAGEASRAAIQAEDVHLVFRIRQRVAGELQCGRALRADVAERCQFLAIVVRNRRRRGHARARDHAVECAPHRASHLRTICRDRRQFLRVLREVVELILRRANEAVAIVAERIKLAPSEMVAGRQRLCVDVRRAERSRVIEDREQRAALQSTCCALDAGENGGRQVDVLDRRSHPSSAPRAPGIFTGILIIKGTWVVAR